MSVTRPTLELPPTAAIAKSVKKPAHGQPKPTALSVSQKRTGAAADGRDCICEIKAGSNEYSNRSGPFPQKRPGAVADDGDY